MRPASLARCLVRSVFLVGLLVALTGASACAKSPPEAHSAPAATPAPAADKGAAPAAAGEDQVLPPGIDVSKLDELAKKIFFRVINSEPSVCGKGESLLASAKKDQSCHRSLNAVKYVARLADQGYTQSEIAESLEKRYRSTDTKFIDVSDERPWRAARRRR